MTNERWNSYFMDVAKRTAELSYATRLKVGAVAVKEKRIIAVGFNGTPPGVHNTCEQTNSAGLMETLDSVVHAEENLILFAARHGISLINTSIYVTHAPCIICARAILGAGFKELIYEGVYRSTRGVEFLEESFLPVLIYRKGN